MAQSYTRFVLLHSCFGPSSRSYNKKLAPGYELGPLGVAVMKANYSTTGRGQRSPPKVFAPAPDPTRARPSGPSAVGTLSSSGMPVHPVENNLLAREEAKGSSSLLAPSEGGAGGGGVEGVGLPPKRGSGLRDLLGTEINVERDRERSRVQAEALKKQVEDNKVGWVERVCGSHRQEKIHMVCCSRGGRII